MGVGIHLAAGVLALFAGSQTHPATPFQLRVDTTKSGASPMSFGLGTYFDAVYNYTVDWGDGSPPESITTSFSPQHTYAADGVYTVSILENVVGGFPQLWCADEFSDSARIVELKQWGSNTWLSMQNAFSGCVNMVITATDHATAKTGDVSDFNAAFFGCASIVSFPLIDMGSGTAFGACWFGCSSMHNFPLVDTSSGTAFGACWLGCTSLSLDAFPTLDLRAMAAGDNCFDGVTLQTASYSALINSINALNSNIGVVFSGGDSLYDSSATAAHTNLTGVKGWTLTDGGVTGGP